MVITKEREYRIAGVTFNNDDGESRQSILRGFCTHGRRIVDVDLVYTSWKDEPAIEIREHITKKCLGYVKRVDISDVMTAGIRRSVAFISEYNGIENARLKKPDYPTNVEYHRMKKMCLTKGVRMPAYDRRAYNVFERLVLR